MKDRQSVAGVLSKIIAVILFLVAVIIFITLLGVDFVSFIAPFGTAVLAISFVFGSAAASAFKSFVFLIFVNPYDVGDRISVDDKMILKVSKIELLSTTCETPEGLTVILPNYRLADSNISNFSRSRCASVFIQVEIDSDTPVPILLEFKTMIFKWLKKNRQIWDTEFGFNVRKVVQQRALIVGLWLNLTNITWAQPGPLFTAKTDFLIFLKEAAAELYIECYGAEAKITVDFESEKAKKKTQKALVAKQSISNSKTDSESSDADDERDVGTPMVDKKRDGSKSPKAARIPLTLAAESPKSIELDEEDNTIPVRAKRRSAALAVNFSDLPTPATPPISPDPPKKSKKSKKGKPKDL